MKRLIFYCVLGFVASFALSAQIVTVDPVFFDIDDKITITYDASQGSRGLVGVTQVYAHTGVIRSSTGAGNWQNVVGNWGTDDPKVKMTSIGGDKHQLEIDIRSFYGLGSAINDVTELAFVFRNADGSKEGKTSSNGDIFVSIPMSIGYDVFFQSPTERQIVVEKGQSIPIRIVASALSSIRLYDNNVLVQDVFSTALTLDYVPTERGNHEMKFEARSGSALIERSFSYVYDPEVSIQSVPSHLDYGFNYDAERQQAAWLIHAPEKEHLFLLSNLNSYQVQSEGLMHLSPDGTDWWIEVPLACDQDVMYQYFVDGSLLIADPLSTLVLDPVHDSGIFNWVDLPAYPTEMTQGHLSYVHTCGADMPTVDPPAIDKSDLVIYEILLRDFLGSRSFSDLADTLGYLQRLGVNAIELMPIQEFEANDSWGYNPSYHMALDKYYGSPQDFRQLVNEAHRHGMVVIVDVVFNHAFGQSPLVQLYWDTQQNRPAANSPYFNISPRHPFNVGYDFNHESQATVNYVQQVLEYWIRTYDIDGFRFDLSKGFTQRESSNNEAMSAYDPSRIAILTEYANHIWSVDADQYVILEHFASNDEELALSQAGMLLWGNGNFNFNEATMGYHEDGKSDFSWQSYVRRGWSEPSVVGYMESHDEERLMYKNMQFGNKSGTYSVQTLDEALNRNAMAAVLFFAIPGPKMIWQFGELGYDFSINRCTNGIVGDCRLDPKPVRWDYQTVEQRRRLYEVYQRMIALKNNHPIFKTSNFSLNVAGAVKTISLKDETSEALAIGNFDVVARSHSVDFNHNGYWYDVFSSDSILVSEGQYTFTLQPGEYHLYFDQQQVSTSVASLDQLGYTIHAYPNPAADRMTITIDGPNSRPLQINIYNYSGMRQAVGIWQEANDRSAYIIDTVGLVSGYYVAIISGSEGRQVVPFVVE